MKSKKSCYLFLLSFIVLSSCTYVPIQSSISPISSDSSSEELKWYDVVKFDFISLDNGCCSVNTSETYDYEKNIFYYYKANEVVFPSYSPQNERVVDASISSSASFKNLETIHLPKSIINVGHNAFDNLKQLKRINIPSSVIKIGNEAFKDDESLLEIKLPKVKKIGNRAFKNCESLQSVDLGSSIIEIEAAAFCQCQSLKTIVFPSSLKKIGASAFSYDYSLDFVTIPKTVETVGYSSFCDCKSLRHLIIEDGVKTISQYAFSDTGLGKAFIPKSVTTLGERAFFSYSKNVTVYCEAKERPEGFSDYYLYEKGVNFVWGVSRSEFDEMEKGEQI